MNRFLRLLLSLALLALCLQQPIFGAAGAQAGKIGTPAACRHAGHGQLKAFGLINMNGRMYDPALGMFLSPDPYIQDPTKPQNLNRYAYCLNNPVMYTDPSGELFQHIIGAIMGAYSGYQIGKAKGAKGWGLFGYTMGGAAIGAVTAGVASWLSGAGMHAVGVGAISGAASGGAFAALGGGDAKKIAGKAFLGAVTGTLSSWIGGSIGGGWGQLVGGGASSFINQMAAYSDEDGFNPLSIAIGAGASWGMYHVGLYLNYRSSWSEKGLVNYQAFARMNRAFQQSRMTGKEYGGYILNGSDEMTMLPEKDCHTLSVTDDFKGDLQTQVKFYFHTHWAKEGRAFWVNNLGDGSSALSNGGSRDPQYSIPTTTAGYHPSDLDLRSFTVPNTVITQRNSSFSVGDGSYTIFPNDPFIRYQYPY